MTTEKAPARTTKGACWMKISDTLRVRFQRLRDNCQYDSDERLLQAALLALETKRQQDYVGATPAPLDAATLTPAFSATPTITSDDIKRVARQAHAAGMARAMADACDAFCQPVLGSDKDRPGALELLQAAAQLLRQSAHLLHDLPSMTTPPIR